MSKILESSFISLSLTLHINSINEFSLLYFLNIPQIWPLLWPSTTTTLPKHHISNLDYCKIFLTGLPASILASYNQFSTHSQSKPLKKQVKPGYSHAQHPSMVSISRNKIKSSNDLQNPTWSNLCVPVLPPLLPHSPSLSTSATLASVLFFQHAKDTNFYLRSRCFFYLNIFPQTVPWLTPLHSGLSAQRASQKAFPHQPGWSSIPLLFIPWNLFYFTSKPISYLMCVSVCVWVCTHV